MSKQPTIVIPVKVTPPSRAGRDFTTMEVLTTTRDRIKTVAKAKGYPAYEVLDLLSKAAS